jgi:hypothetical protein
MRSGVSGSIPSVALASLPAACGSDPQPAVVYTQPPAVVAPRTAAAAPAVRLSADEALGLLTNNTAVGLTFDGTPYRVYFGDDGVARYRTAELTDGGTWRVLTNGEVCSRLPQLDRGAENCYVLARYGDVILYGQENGPPLGSIRVVAGDILGNS